MPLLNMRNKIIVCIWGMRRAVSSDYGTHAFIPDSQGLSFYGEIIRGPLYNYYYLLFVCE